MEEEKDRKKINKPSGSRRQGSEEKKPRVARLLSRRFGTWINEWTNGRVDEMRCDAMRRTRRKEMRYQNLLSQSISIPY